MTYPSHDYASEFNRSDLWFEAPENTDHEEPEEYIDSIYLMPKLPSYKKLDFSLDRTKGNIARLQLMIKYLDKGELLLEDIAVYNGNNPIIMTPSEERCAYFFELLKKPEVEVDVSHMSCVFRSKDRKVSGDPQEFILFCYSEGIRLKQSEYGDYNCLQRR